MIHACRRLGFDRLHPQLVRGLVLLPVELLARFVAVPRSSTCAGQDTLWPVPTLDTAVRRFGFSSHQIQDQSLGAAAAAGL